MSPHPHDGRAQEAAARTIARVLAGDSLPYELTGEPGVRVLHPPGRVSARPPAAGAGRASRRAGGGATSAP
jgi:hypothetical protein